MLGCATRRVRDLFECLNCLRISGSKLDDERLEHRPLQAIEDVEHGDAPARERSISLGCAIVEDDVVATEWRRWQGNVEDSRPRWIKTMCPHDLPFSIGIQSHRNGAVVHVRWRVSRRERYAACLPSPSGLRPLPHRGGSDSQVPPSGLVVGIQGRGSLIQLEGFAPAACVLAEQAQVVVGDGPVRGSFDRGAISGFRIGDAACLAMGVAETYEPVRPNSAHECHDPIVRPARTRSRPSGSWLIVCTQTTRVSADSIRRKQRVVK